MKTYLQFWFALWKYAFSGGWKYYSWMLLLTAASLIGLNAYCRQFVDGLITTGLSDQVSWGAYVSNFTFLASFAGVAMMLVIPAGIQRDHDLRHVTIISAFLAVVSVVMCLLFVLVDIGQPLRAWHMLPVVGRFGFPVSLPSWDWVFLNGYLLLCLYVCGRLMYCVYRGRNPARSFYLSFVLLALVWATCLYVVTGFLYAGLGGRPFWNSTMVAPRFLLAVLAAGAAFVAVTFQMFRRLTTYRVPEAVFLKLRRVLQIAMAGNLFLLFSEVFQGLFSHSAGGATTMYLFFGPEYSEYAYAVVTLWIAVLFNVVALILLVLPFSRNLRVLNIACALALLGIWIEKGMEAVLPAFSPTPLGEAAKYRPNMHEILVCLGIWAFGTLLYTFFLKAASPVLSGSFRKNEGRKQHGATWFGDKEGHGGR